MQFPAAWPFARWTPVSRSCTSWHCVSAMESETESTARITHAAGRRLRRTRSRFIGSSVQALGQIPARAHLPAQGDMRDRSTAAATALMVTVVLAPIPACLDAIHGRIVTQSFERQARAVHIASVDVGQVESGLHTDRVVVSLRATREAARACLREMDAKRRIVHQLALAEREGEQNQASGQSGADDDAAKPAGA